MFHRYKLRPGDILYSKLGTAVLTRQTRSYWYYYLKGSIARVNKQSLWNLVDERKLNISYGSNMKYRRKNRKGRTLDLHGVRHAEAEERVRVFLNFVELPCKIITGDSEKMADIVKKIVKTYAWKCYNDPYNTGILIITGDD